MKTKPKGLDRPSTVRVIRAMSALHTRMYRATGGRLGKHWRIGAGARRPVPVCLLTTTGRTSGQPRTVPLCYARDGERIVLIASQGGLPHHPQWYRNLLANPEVRIEIGRAGRRYRAAEAEGEERERLWEVAVAAYPDYAAYQSWTERRIPVVVCDPIG